MIANTALWVVIIGVISSLKVGIKADKWLSWLAFISIFFVFGYFIQGVNKDTTDILSFVWNSTAAGNINVDIVTNKYNCLQILPFFIITLASISNNILLRYEERRSLYDSFLLFNIFALIMMITSSNFVQLLSALFLVDILSFFIIKDIEMTRKFMLVNLIADMLLFACMAIINANVNSLDIAQIKNFSGAGFVSHFISALGGVSILMKFGIFPFHKVFSDLKQTRFHRLQNVLYLTSPISALILLLKFYPLLAKSSYFASLFLIALFVNFLIGTISFVYSDNLKEKMINFQMIFWSLILYLLINKSFIWDMELAKIYICSWVFGSVLYFIYNSSNRHSNLSEILKLQLCSGYTVIGSIFVSFFAIKILMPLIFIEFLIDKNYFILSFGIGILICISSILKFIYIEDKSNSSNNLNRSPINSRLLLVPIMILIGLMYDTNVNIYHIIVSVILFIFFILIIPSSFLINPKINKDDKDISMKLYQIIIIRPLYIVGRFFGLLVDRLFVEKIIIGTTTLSFEGCIKIFRSIHNNKIYWSLAVIIIVGGLLLSYGEGIEFNE